jgi:hypothetical protein
LKSVSNFITHGTGLVGLGLVPFFLVFTLGMLNEKQKQISAKPNRNCGGS